MSLLESIQIWLGQVLLPVTVLGILALVVRVLMFKANAARRTMVGYAALTGMTLALFTPWLPRFARVAPEATAPIIRIRDTVVQAAEKVVAPGMVANQAHPSALTAQEIGWALYLAVTAFLAVRLAIGLRKVAKIRRTAESSLLENEFPVFYHNLIGVPVAFDGLKRCIVLPTDAKGWSEERLSSVLRHEEAHLRHRDGLWLCLSQLLCIAFWFNPVVWLVNRRFRRDIEFLADDEVVLSGIVPTTYAQDMLEAAKNARQIRYATATAFASKASLKQRIASVLSEQKNREAVGMKKLGIAIVVASIATLGIAGWQNGPWQKVANPTSWDPDVKAGLTSPANPANGFVGILRDGRKVELVQITQKVGGALLAWKPDGSPILAKNVIPVGKPSQANDNMRFLLFRIERAKDTTEMMASLGSGSHGNSDQPKTMTYSGGWMLKDDGGPYLYGMSIIEIEETGGSTGYFTMSVSDAPWNLEGKVNPNATFTPSFGSVENLKLKSVVEPQDELREDWTKTNPGPWVEITWKSKDGREQDSTKQVAVVWTPKGLVEKEPEGSYGGYTSNQYFARYYLSGPLANIRELRFYSRSSKGVEINGVKLKPNQVP